MRRLFLCVECDQCDAVWSVMRRSFPVQVYRAQGRVGAGYAAVHRRQPLACPAARAPVLPRALRASLVHSERRFEPLLVLDPPPPSPLSEYRCLGHLALTALFYRRLEDSSDL